jgi:hypothetical protein
MRWKNFNEEMPPVCKQVLFRLNNKKEFFIGEIKRPYDVNPIKYNENFYQIKKIYPLFSEWVDLCNDFKNNYEWLNPDEE